MASRLPVQLGQPLLRGGPQLRRVALQRHYVRLSSTSAASSHLTTQVPRPTNKGRVLQTLPLPILVRSLLVLSVAALPSKLLSIIIQITKQQSQRLAASKLLRWPIEKTFYNTFCIGEERVAIQNNTKALRSMGLDGIVLAFARETKELTEETDTRLTKENPQLREWVAMNLETLESLTSEDYLALRCTGAGTATVRALGDFTSATAGSREYDVALEHLNVFRDALLEIAEAAHAKGVRILIDAESTIHQPAIDHAALDAMAKYNRGRQAIIYNTYQMYLQSTIAKMVKHIQISKDQGYTIGIKMVRGAYIHTEPNPSIIHTSKENTDNCYDDAVKYLFGGKIPGHDAKITGHDTKITGHDALEGKPWNAEVMLATHNLASVQKALALWRESDGLKDAAHGNGGTVQSLSFAQLMGMADEVSLELVAEIKQHNAQAAGEKVLPGIGVYKYTIWGSFEECLLYMLRRAEENQDAVARTRSTAWEVGKEIGRRFVPFGRA